MKANRADEQGNRYAKVVTHYFVGLDQLNAGAVWYVADRALATQGEYSEIVAGMKRSDVEKALKDALTTYGQAFLEGSLSDYVVGLYHPQDQDDVLEMVRPVVEDLFPDFRWGT